MPARDADSVRYIVLRKLASGLRHTLMGELQTIQFFAELAGRLLGKELDEARMRDTVGKLPGASQAAVATCRSVIEWLRPEEGSTATIGEAMQQCLRLVGDDWAMRGIAATMDVPDGTGATRVDRAAIRELTVTSLLAMSDVRPGPLDIRATAKLEDDEVEVCFEAKRSKRTAMLAPVTVYRTLDWDDVAVLAQSHGVACSRDGETVSLRFQARLSGR